jgi:hypothetical protein
MWIVLGQIILFPVIYLAVLNAIGPSTEYHNPQIGTAERGPDGTQYVYLGEEFYVWISIVRHRLNGSCLFDIRRYAEVVGGPRNGRMYLISKAELQFVGQNEMRRTRWPVPEEKYILGYAVNDNNEPQFDMPLLPHGVDEREFTFYVVGRYYCNALDYIFPRYIQGGDRPNITPRVNAVLRRHRP